jgi:hypothetical protein
MERAATPNPTPLARGSLPQKRGQKSLPAGTARIEMHFHMHILHQLVLGHSFALLEQAIDFSALSAKSNFLPDNPQPWYKRLARYLLYSSNTDQRYLGLLGFAAFLVFAPAREPSYLVGSGWQPRQWSERLAANRQLRRLVAKAEQRLEQKAHGSSVSKSAKNLNSYLEG